MPSIHDLFTYYLKAEHLRGRTAVVHIESVSITKIFVPNVKKEEPHLVVRFHGKKLALICNKTQALAFSRIAGTDDYTKWVGCEVALTPTKAPSGQDTILVTSPPAKPASDAQTDEGEQEEQVEHSH